MPGLRLKSLWPLWLILVLIFAAMPRPAAGTNKNCPLNDEMAAPATAAIAPAPAAAETEDPSLPAAKGATRLPVPVIPDHPAVTTPSRKTNRSHPAGTHGPRTQWPDMIPMGR